MKRKDMCSLIEARHNKGLSRRSVRMSLRISLDELRKYEYQLAIPDEKMQKRFSKLYEADNIQWKYKLSEVSLAAQMMDVAPLTMRKYLQDGKLGMAIKGSGNKWIYRVDWLEVEKWERLRYS